MVSTCDSNCKLLFAASERCRFFDRFAIAGEPDYCVERMQELLDAVPLERVVIMNRSRGADPNALSEVQACLEQEVLPALKN